MQYKCSACEDTGSIRKSLTGNLDCTSCDVATDRVLLEAFIARLPAMGEQEMAWRIHQRALSMAPKQEAPAQEPVAYCVADAKGKPTFGKGWMFSPVPQLKATMPLFAAPAVANGALTDEQILLRAAPIFGEQDDRNVRNDDLISFARAIIAAAGPDAAMIEDAMRYRFLRKLQKPACFWPVIMITQEWLCTPEEVDAAIDAALSGTKGN